MSDKFFSFNSELCIQCWACEIVCKQWNALPADAHAHCQISEKTEGTFPYVSRTFVFSGCQHCTHPACIDACPENAIQKRVEDGLVVVDQALCKGCFACKTACPFNAIQAYGNTILKCDGCLCAGTSPTGLPRCVETCPTHALTISPKGATE